MNPNTGWRDQGPYPAKPWVKISRQGYLTQIHAAMPGPGVWYRAQVDTKESQHTYEIGAKDGITILQAECYHGQARMAFFRKLVAFAKER